MNIWVVLSQFLFQRSFKNNPIILHTVLQQVVIPSDIFMVPLLSYLVISTVHMNTFIFQTLIKMTICYGFELF